MIHQQLLHICALCLLFSCTLSLRCYTGTNEKCYSPPPDIEMCSPNEKCQCAMYRFKCCKGDTACNEDEQTTGAMKWSYNVISEESCLSMQMEHPSNPYSNVMCCATDECNRPQNIKCSSIDLSSWSYT